MNEPIRRLSVLALVLFLILMGAASYVQVLEADSLNADARNVRTLYREYGNFRGPIIVDGEAIVYSTPVDSPFNYQRTYVDGPLYASVTGYYSIVFGRTGVEQTENSLLNGTADALFWSRLGDLFAGREQEGASVELTIRASLQAAAAEALGDQRGAVVALDPRTGEILAMVTSPSYDPTLVAGHHTPTVNQNYQALLADPTRPLINRAIAGDTYPPGSVFKLVVAAAALEAGLEPGSEIFAPKELALPQTSNTIRNYGGVACTASGDTTTLEDALRTSCNTAFADLGMALGWDAIEAKALEFGWEQKFDIPLSAAVSQLPENPDVPQTAMSALGQYDVRATPLQLAMLAAAIANDGELMTPYLIRAIRSPDLQVLERADPSVYSTPMSPAIANALTDMMVTVVDNGTGRNARIEGVTVAGKTGTAETGVGGSPHAHFIAFAPAENPIIAVAVVIENGGDLGDEATGGRLAAPIARAVIEAALALARGQG
ncbi:MAG: cell division protein FtsI [Actinobacteria bacterium HGW-Actinobacteria-4]|nr:MAG: cell division protein FtsI [Actinobacteria bacterium HGW-Actinobacteria-4]